MTSRHSNLPGRRAVDVSQRVYLADNSCGLTVGVVPEAGARIAEIVDTSGRNWLVDTGRREPSSGSRIDFVNGSRGGWDECMPSVVACPDPNAGRSGMQIGDHGDFWCLPWAVRRRSTRQIVLDSDEIDHPLRIVKTVSLSQRRRRLTVNLNVVNRSGAAYSFLYSAHPLWAWQGPAAIELPAAGVVRVAFGARWDKASEGTWPLVMDASGLRHNVADVPESGVPENYKFFVRWDGRARLCFPALHTAVVVRQPSKLTPWLGICVNRNAWPGVGEGENWIAIEPTTAPTDSLLNAMREGATPSLSPGDSLSWTNTVELVDTSGEDYAM